MRMKLKYTRLQSGKTFQQVANEVGISKEYYWQIENGRRRLYYDLAVKIANVFNKKPDDLFLLDELTNEELNTENVSCSI